MPGFFAKTKIGAIRLAAKNHLAAVALAAGVRPAPAATHNPLRYAMRHWLPQMT